MSTYFIAQIKIHDPIKYKDYLSGFDEVFSRYDAEVVLVDENPEVLEGDWQFSRIVLLKFRDRDEARRWYRSLDYQKLAQYRIKASDAVVLFAGDRN